MSSVRNDCWGKMYANHSSVLDDNTYTNKTWAEVSGISVTEIHVMEVEFLSNMRYTLLASREQWAEWQEKLGRFWTYCDRATKAPLLQTSPQEVSTLHPNLPSPPASMQSSPPSATNLYPSGLPAQNHQLADLQLQARSRKRSYDGEEEEPAAKRATRASASVPATYNTTLQPIRTDAPRLPVPNLTISTSQPLHNGYNGAPILSQNVPLLPPLNGRAKICRWLHQLGPRVSKDIIVPVGTRLQPGVKAHTRYKICYHWAPHPYPQISLVTIQGIFRLRSSCNSGPLHTSLFAM